MISVLIVDDSGFMRLALRKMLSRDAGIRVVAEAATGEEAVRLVKSHRPDVITMDIEMPGKSGLEATRAIMAHYSIPIIVISSLTKRGSETAFKALDFGAVDCISKASSFVDLDIVAIEKELLHKVRYWGERRLALAGIRRSEIQAGGETRKHAAVHTLKLLEKPDLVVVGASTGGPKALPELFSAVAPLTCPVVIALHMPPLYTESFAQHLGDATGHRTREGFDGDTLKDGDVVVLPGGVDTQIRSGGDGRYALRVVANAGYNIHPSVDALFLSAAAVGKSVIAVIMTGMGEDGRVGAVALNKRGFPVIAQSEQSCLIYGMPKAVVDADAASASLSLPEIAQKLSAWAGRDRPKNSVEWRMK